MDYVDTGVECIECVDYIADGLIVAVDRVPVASMVGYLTMAATRHVAAQSARGLTQLGQESDCVAPRRSQSRTGEVANRTE